MNLEAYLAERRARVDAALEQALRPREGTPPRLHEAMCYAALSGGKRVRPILALAACEAVPGPPELALPFGCAIEMIHAYSLVHDDLPAMDDDALRRGRPTVHVAFGEATAILAGDALLTEAFRVAAEGALRVGLVPPRPRCCRRRRRRRPARGRRNHRRWRRPIRPCPCSVPRRRGRGTWRWRRWR